MKTKLFTVIVIALLSLSFSANLFATVPNEKLTKKEVGSEEDSPLVGIWQLCNNAVLQGEGEYNYVSSPFLKFINKDGTFQNFMMSAGGENTISAITANGTYEKTSATTYLEKVEYSVFGRSGEDVEMHYEIVNKKYLKLRYCLKKEDTGASEDRWFEEFYVKAELATL